MSYSGDLRRSGHRNQNQKDLGPSKAGFGINNTTTLDAGDVSNLATSYDRLSMRVRRRLDERFDSSSAVNALARATDGEMFIFGGAVRRSWFGDSLSGDIDIMVPNGDERAFKALQSLQVPYVLNSQNLRRYRWNSLQIDLFQPREFFHGFEDAEAALRFFDLKVNALSFYVRTRRILDPFKLISLKPVMDPGINWDRWTLMSPPQLVVLAIRLTKIMYELPQFLISTSDAERLEKEVIPRIREFDWEPVRYRFPLGKDVFLRTFNQNVLRRVRSGKRDANIQEWSYRGEMLRGG